MYLLPTFHLHSVLEHLAQQSLHHRCPFQTRRIHFSCLFPITFDSGVIFQTELFDDLLYLFGKLKARFVKAFPNFKPPAPKLPVGEGLKSNEHLPPPAPCLAPEQAMQCAPPPAASPAAAVAMAAPASTPPVSAVGSSVACMGGGVADGAVDGSADGAADGATNLPGPSAATGGALPKVDLFDA